MIFKDLLMYFEGYSNNERRRQRELFHPCLFTPLMAIAASLGHAEARNQEFNPGLHIGGSNPNTWTVFHCVSRDFQEAGMETKQPGHDWHHTRARYNIMLASE